MVQYKWDKYAGTELPVTANMYWQISIGTQVERGPEEGFQMEWIWTIWGFSSRGNGRGCYVSWMWKCKWCDSWYYSAPTAGKMLDCLYAMDLRKPGGLSQDLPVHFVQDNLQTTATGWTSSWGQNVQLAVQRNKVATWEFWRRSDLYQGWLSYRSQSEH